MGELIEFPKRGGTEPPKTPPETGFYSDRPEVQARFTDVYGGRAQISGRKLGGYDNRWFVFREIADFGPLTVEQLLSDLPMMAASTAKRHLTDLAKNGLVRTFGHKQWDIPEW